MFSLVSLAVMHVSGSNIYQMKAEYHSYLILLIIILFKKERKNYIGKYIKKSELLPSYFQMGISQSIFDEIHSNFLWLFLTLLWREPCLRLLFLILDQIQCNLEN